jgi:ketosteroid isomerase-like protein
MAEQPSTPGFQQQQLQQQQQQRLIEQLTAQLRAVGIQPAAVIGGGAPPTGRLSWSPDAYGGDGLTREYAVALVEEYGAAWTAQDEERITRIFTEDARYLEHPYDPKRIYEGRAGIRDYWVRQIQGKQKDIVFRQFQDALLLDPERHTVLAKWEAEFLNIQRDGATYLPVTFVQVAMLTIDVETGLISALEEYWTSKGKYGKGERMGAMDDSGKVWKNRRAIIRANKKKMPKLQAGGMWMGAYAMR